MRAVQHFDVMTSHPAVADVAVRGLALRVWTSKNTRIRADGLSARGGESRA